MKKLAMITLALWLLLPFGALAEAREVTSTDLIENALALDGQTVTYTGEVVGDIMKRGDHTWLNLSDGSNAMGVWAETAALGADCGCGAVWRKGRYGRGYGHVPPRVPRAWRGFGHPCGYADGGYAG